MITPPQLPAPLADLPVQEHLALLLNPFYPKDPRASFGKHVLTPSLALTSIAATTPAHWQVRYWDENLGDLPPSPGSPASRSCWPVGAPALAAGSIVCTLSDRV
jgi:hypothetical protein